MTQSGGRKRALVGLTATALLGLGLFAPSASAQIGTVTDAVGSTTGSAGSTTGSVGSTAGSTTTKVTDTVKDTTAPVETTGGTVTETVDKVGGTVDSNTGTSTYEKTKETVNNTTQGAADTVQKTAGTVGQTVEDTSGGLVQNPNLNVENPLDRNKKGNKQGTGSKASGPASSKQGSPAARKAELAAAREARQNATDRMATVAAAERNRQPGPLAAASAIVPQRESFLSNLGEAAREALEKAAFPLGLALMVGAFLMVQGRIDRKDAKLALAPIDSEQDLLSFQ